MKAVSQLKTQKYLTPSKKKKIIRHGDLAPGICTHLPYNISIFPRLFQYDVGQRQSLNYFCAQGPHPEDVWVSGDRFSVSRIVKLYIRGD